MRVCHSITDYYSLLILYFFFFNDTATTEIYTLSLHDALPISRRPRTILSSLCLRASPRSRTRAFCGPRKEWQASRASACWRDRKSTRLNSSHANISYAVFCLKKKKKHKKPCLSTQYTSTRSVE